MTGQSPTSRLAVVGEIGAPLLSAAAAGEVAVEEYGYGLGPPTGMLLLHYPAGPVVAEFPESRNDYVHQIFWSPDDMLWVRRGATVQFVGEGRAVWIRRGVIAEVSAVGRQRVFRVCVRRAPEPIEATAAAVVDLSARAAQALIAAARPGVSEQTGLATRALLLDDIATGTVTDVAHRAMADGPARAVAQAILQDPADPTSLSEWAGRVNVSTKTLQRDFARCFGESFSAWRTRTRLEASMAMLSRWSVTETAHRVGYASASAYVAAFTRAYGETPGHRTRNRCHFST